MQLNHFKTCSQCIIPGQSITKVTAVCWSPNGQRLAMCTSDRVVLLFDDKGEQKDKFSTKPIDKVNKFFKMIGNINSSC